MYKTINVKPETYARLLMYKHAGLTFDEVLNELMNLVSEDKFYKIILKEHRKRMRDKDFIEASSLEEALKRT